MKSYREHVSKQEKFLCTRVSQSVLLIGHRWDWLMLIPTEQKWKQMKQQRLQLATTTDTATSDAVVSTSSKLTSTTVTEGNKTEGRRLM